MSIECSHQLDYSVGKAGYKTLVYMGLLTSIALFTGILYEWRQMTFVSLQGHKSTPSRSPEVGRCVRAPD